MAEEKFQSIYGDAESEFDVEDVSDETLSISKEEIEEKIEEQSKDAEPTEETAPEEKPAPVEEETPKEEEPTEEPSPVEEPHEEESPEEEEQPSEPEEEPEIEGVSFEEHAVHYHEEDDESGYAPIEDHPHEDHDDADDREEDDHVSVISYILHAILFTIPVIGTILMLVYIISDNKNEHLRHFAQIWLITLLIIAIGAYAAITILGIA